MRSTSVLVCLLLACAACGNDDPSSREAAEQRKDGVGAHDLCVTGDPLDPTTDECVAAICAVDSSCCTLIWNQVCVGEVSSICGGWCPDPGTGYCGDLVCDANEDNWSCPIDCTYCGDGECEYGENCASCSADCGGCASHGLCEEGGPLDPTYDWCTAQICSVDSSCCNLVWNQVCVGEVSSICGLVCPPTHPFCGDGVCSNESCKSCEQDCGGCTPHDLCEEGDPLPSYTNDCTELICGGADPYCCSSWWDAQCVAEVTSICGQECLSEPTNVFCGDGVCDKENCVVCEQDCGACTPHDVCETGDPLPSYTDGCTEQVCAADPYCCGYAWDSQCVYEVGSICGQQCPTP